MSIERQYGNGPVIFICDDESCHEYYDSGTTDFRQALADARHEGWKVRKVCDDWLHFCKDHDA